MSSPLNSIPKFGYEDFQHIGAQEIARGKEVLLAQYIYKDPVYGEKVWEVASRCYRPEGEVDCVSTLTILRRLLKYDCLVLVKQYRPPLKAFTLEMPTGLVDPDEKIEETGLREMKEETGYTGTTIKHTSPGTAMDPVLSNSTMKIVTVDVDGDRPENLYPQQSTEDHERIEVVHIPVSELLHRLNEYSDQGVVVDSRVYCFAVGMAMGVKCASLEQ